MSTIRQFFCWFTSIDWTPEAVTAAATIALAFLTLVLAVGTLFLWFATRRLVKGSEKTAERQLRAYVGITTGHLSLEEEAGVITPKVSIRIKNFGQTPAHDVSSSIGVENATKFTASINDKKVVIPGKNTVFPKASQRLLFNGTFNIPAGDEVFSTFVFGSIVYDTFGQSRTTNFRYTARNIDDSGRTNLIPCDEGNNAN